MVLQKISSACRASYAARGRALLSDRCSMFRSITGRERRNTCCPDLSKRSAGQGGDGFGGCGCDPGRPAMEQRPGLLVVAGDDGHFPLLLCCRGRRPRVRPLDNHHCKCKSLYFFFSHCDLNFSSPIVIWTWLHFGCSLFNCCFAHLDGIIRSSSRIWW